MSTRSELTLPSPLGVQLVSPLPPPPGGIATWTRILLKELCGHPEVTVAHLDTGVRWRAVTQVSPPLRVAGGTVQAARDYLRFRSRLATVHPAVVHVCTSAGLSLLRDLLMLRAARRFGARSVIHYRMGRIPTVAGSNGVEWKRLQACTNAATTTLVLDRRSEAALREACPRADVRTMPNMVDLAAIDAALEGMPDKASADGSPFVLAYTGHVLPAKGVTDLVRACIASGRTVELELIGPVEDAYLRSLRRMSAESEKRLRLVSRGTLSHEEALRAIASASAATLPSHTEGFPNAVAEAMGCGRAVLATDVGAMPEMLLPDTGPPCGICAPVGDVGALADGIRALSDDVAERERMGRAGRARAAQEYAAPAVTGRLAALWREIGG